MSAKSAYRAFQNQQLTWNQCAFVLCPDMKRGFFGDEESTERG